MKQRNRLPLWAALILDILAAAVLIGCWFLARILSDSLHQEAPIVVAELRATPPPEASAPPAEEEEAGPAKPEATPDLRSEWQIRFAEHFTPEVVITEDSYTSPNVSVTISHHVFESDKGPVAYHLADIYIGNIDCFRAGLAATPPRFHMSASLQKMAEDENAVVAVNGDFCSYSFGGVAIRNGLVVSPLGGDVELCVLYRDGTMETISPRQFHLDEAIERDVWQVWTFGPFLLNEDGSPRDIPYYALPLTKIAGRNPRTALGYFEPGHYCFLVADGRQPDYSVGMTLQEMSEIFSALGCQSAFNLDGGGSSMMVFQNELVSQIYSHLPRNLSDCVLITDFDPAALPAEEEPAPAEEEETP